MGTVGPASSISFCRRGEPLSESSSAPGDLFLLSTGEATEEVLRLLLLAGSYRSSDRRRFLSLPPRLRLLDGLRRRRRGGVLLLLLRVSRRSRSLRVLVRVSISSAGVGEVSVASLLRDILRTAARLTDRDREVDGDLDLELE